ncbi:hypothetical protein PRUPE_1G295400 [Prunus persica]|uniref:Uncharacterized protein n=1 Tax=Prunus persica TaxID=3760 RepID=M5XJS7_PRUPE|nr:hypothetical protein PRUPE_1G295400 [Prunus persica]
MKSSSYCLLLFVLVSAASIWGIYDSFYNLYIYLQGQDIDEVEDKKIGGRKMGAIHKVVRLEKEVKVEVDAVSGRKSNSKTASSSSSELEGKSPRRSHEANTIGNGESGQSSSVKGGVDHDHNDEYSAGFVAFSQDYHSPRHHPPKNN